MRLMDDLPPWLRASQPASPQYERTRQYFRQMFAATPAWLTREQRDQFYAVYRTMRQMRAAGRDVQVDHIVPLVSKYVCGLNVPWNLEIRPARSNMAKGNRWWPGCPWEPRELPLPDPGPHQMGLPL